MRRRWQVDWRYLWALAFAYGIVGICCVLAIGLIWRNHDRHGHDTGGAWVHSPIHWFLPLWLAPFAATGFAFAVYHGIRFARANPFIRRVTEPVVKDLREAARGGEGS